MLQLSRRAALLLLLGLAVCHATSHDKGAGGKPGGAGKPDGGVGGKPGGQRPPPAADRPTDEKKPTGCSQLQCENSGVCQMRGPGPFCNCTATNYCGRKCEKTTELCSQADADSAGRQRDAVKADKARDALDKAKEKCTDPAKQMLCPKCAPTAVVGTCVSAVAECFASDAEMKACKDAKDAKCPVEGERYCDQEDICLGRGASCAPAEECHGSKPFRCANWVCAADAAGCAAAGQGSACAAGEQRCPDGLCYPGTGGLKECAKKGVQWKGCPPETVQCKGGKTGVCAPDEAQCAEKVGCVSPLVACGFKREPGTGKPQLNETTGRCVANCVEEAQCTVGRGRPPKATTRPLDPSVGGELEAKSEDGKTAVKLKMSRGAFSVGGDFGRAVNFSVASVPDSLLQQGAFAKHFERGALVGELVTIEPSAEVEIVGGMAVDIPILDQTAQTDAAACLLILANTNMLAIDDISDVEEVPTSMGTCVKGEIGGCSCATNVTHFSTFAVVDQTVLVRAARLRAARGLALFVGVRVSVSACVPGREC